MLELVVATRNPGKVKEIVEALSGLELKVRSLADFPGAPEVTEDGESFEENAIKKARSCAAHTGRHSIADDSGLSVDALGGAPGVYSARYAGPRADDLANNQKLLAELAGVPPARRTARFTCVIALCSPTGEIALSEGGCDGLIMEAMRGDRGFGYDPLFLYPPAQKTFGELLPKEKLSISHRGLALQSLQSRLRELIESVR